MRRGFWLLTALLLALGLVGSTTPAQAAPPRAITTVDAKIEIVWPHNNAPVRQARLANITVYLFEPGTVQTVPCDFDPTVRLWRALNNNPASNSGMPIGQKRMLTRNGVTFPVWDFNDVDVSAAADGVNKLYFYVTVDDVTANFNVWSHGADARTYLPQPTTPTGIRNAAPEAVDARIQVVWPHDRFGQAQPVNRATQANVTVALFHSTIPFVNDSVGGDFNRRVLLFKSLNNGPMQLAGTGVKRMVRQGNFSYPVWDFNDIDVAQAQNGLNKYYFRVLVDGTRTFSTIWSHGADARTIFPTPDQPTGGCGRLGPAVSITPSEGPSGTVIRVSASGFAPNTLMTALAGPENSEASTINDGRTTGSGVWEFDWRIVGGTGQRWRVTVMTVPGPNALPISARSGVFTITGQAPTPGLKFYWPTLLPQRMVIQKDGSWADESGFALAMGQVNQGQFRATLYAGSATDAIRHPAFPGATATIRGIRMRTFTTGAGYTILWEENGVQYTLISSLGLQDATNLIEGLDSVSLSTWRTRLDRL